MKTNPISRTENLVTQELKDEILIYDQEINKALCLNKTSSLVWLTCDGTKNVSEVSAALSRKLNQNYSSELVWLALEQLKEANLIANPTQVNSPFISISRRQLVRKAGLASMVMLPLITGIVAPTSAQAASPGAVTITACSNAAACCPANTSVGGSSTTTTADCLTNARSKCCSGNGTQFGNAACLEFFGSFNCGCNVACS